MKVISNRFSRWVATVLHYSFVITFRFHFKKDKFPHQWHHDVVVGYERVENFTRRIVNINKFSHCITRRQIWRNRSATVAHLKELSPSCNKRDFNIGPRCRAKVKSNMAGLVKLFRGIVKIAYLNKIKLMPFMSISEKCSSENGGCRSLCFHARHIWT